MVGPGKELEPQTPLTTSYVNDLIEYANWVKNPTLVDDFMALASRQKVATKPTKVNKGT